MCYTTLRGNQLKYMYKKNYSFIHHLPSIISLRRGNLKYPENEWYSSRWISISRCYFRSRFFSPRQSASAEMCLKVRFAETETDTKNGCKGDYCKVDLARSRNKFLHILYLVLVQYEKSYLLEWFFLLLVEMWDLFVSGVSSLQVLYFAREIT